MVELKFTGDVNQFSEKQKELILRVVEERGFKNGTIDIQSVGDIGDNYTALAKRITVQENGKFLKMFAKVAPTNETQRAMMNSAFYFKNEKFMYTEVFPKFTELEKAANIPEKDRLRYAACFGTLIEPPNELILLEDLKESGFSILGRFVTLTDENVRMVLKNFAILHSLSYVLKTQESETYERLTKSLVNIWEIVYNTPDFSSWCQNLDEEIQEVLQDGKYKTAVKNALENMKDSSLKLARSDKGSKRSVIQQGDAWTNNFMFRLKEDKPIQCCMIDYQLSKETNPVEDLHYMIFFCTDHATRSKYYQHWIDYYHSALDECLNNFGLKVSYIFPRDQLDADLRRYSKVALGKALMLSAILLRETEQVMKLKEAMKEGAAEMSMDAFRLPALPAETIQKFTEKLEGVVDSFIELGYM